MLRFISSHSDANMWLFTGLVFTKFIMRTTSSGTGARSAGNVLTMSASRCRKQCVAMTSGCCSFTLFTNPLVRPSIAAAPSVQTLMQFCHFSPPCSRYSDTTRKISSHVVLSGNSLQNITFSLIVSLSTKHTFAISCACPLISIDLSS